EQMGRLRDPRWLHVRRRCADPRLALSGRLYRSRAHGRGCLPVLAGARLHTGRQTDRPVGRGVFRSARPVCYSWFGLTRSDDMTSAMARGAVATLTLVLAFWAGASSSNAQQPPAAGQAPAGGAARGGRGGGPVLSVTSTSFPDGGEVPMNNAGRGGNKSPAFTFQWMMGTMPADPPATLQSYTVILHDVENSTARGTADTLHWSAFNIL